MSTGRPRFDTEYAKIEGDGNYGYFATFAAAGGLGLVVPLIVSEGFAWWSDDYMRRDSRYDNPNGFRSAVFTWGRDVDQKKL